MLNSVVRALSQGIEKQGHDVTVINGKTDRDKSLTPYNYIAVGTAAPSLFSKKAPDGLGVFLKSAGLLSGKRCYAFIAGGGFRKTRLLASLMKIMESEGMYLKTSNIIGKPHEAKVIGSRLHIDNSKR